MTPQEFAAQVNARLTLPSDPKRVRSVYEKTDVQKTWARFSQGKGIDATNARMTDGGLA